MFDISDFQQSKFSMDYFKEWAGEIASSYLGSGIAPTTSLVKIAKSVELVPHQIELLAAEANKLIHQHKYANETEKYHAANFPLADAKEAIKELNLSETIKTASFVEPVIEDNYDPYKMFGVSEIEMDKTASVKHQAKVAEAKTELLSQKLADAKIVTASKLEEAQHEFIKKARQFALDADSSADRMKVLGVIDHFVKCSNFKSKKPLLAKLAYVLEKEGKLETRHAKIATEYFTKEADCKAPQELISENLNVQVVNGNHPLYISLKTIDELEADNHRFNRESKIVDDKLKILKQTIRAL
jgi:hypothetical protein